MKESIQIKHIQNADELETLQTPWNHLMQESGIKDVFLTWEWLSAWWKEYGLDKELWLVTAWKSDELVGIAPLMLENKRKSGLPVRILKTLGTPESDVGGFLVRDGNGEILEVIWDYILREARQWDGIHLKEFCYDAHQTRHILEIFKKYGLCSLIKVKEHYYIPVQGTWDEFIKSLSKNTRKGLNRRMRRAEEYGKVSLERNQGPYIEWKHFEQLFGINQTGNYPNLYNMDQEQRFHRELMERMQSKDWMNIDFLYIDNKPVAFQYGFFFDNRYEDWRGGFDKSYHELSVGKLLLNLSIEQLFQNGFKEHDFLRGTYDYKSIWNSKSRSFINIRAAFPNNINAIIAFIFLPKIKRLLKSILRKFKGN